MLQSIEIAVVGVGSAGSATHMARRRGGATKLVGLSNLTWRGFAASQNRVMDPTKGLFNGGGKKGFPSTIGSANEWGNLAGVAFKVLSCSTNDGVA